MGVNASSPAGDSAGTAPELIADLDDPAALIALFASSLSVLLTTDGTGDLLLEFLLVVVIEFAGLEKGAVAPARPEERVDDGMGATAGVCEGGVGAVKLIVGMTDLSTLFWPHCSDVRGECTSIALIAEVVPTALVLPALVTLGIEETEAEPARKLSADILALSREG